MTPLKPEGGFEVKKTLKFYWADFVSKETRLRQELGDGPFSSADYSESIVTIGTRTLARHFFKTTPPVS